MTRKEIVDRLWQIIEDKDYADIETHLRLLAKEIKDDGFSPCPECLTLTQVKY